MKLLVGVIFVLAAILVFPMFMETESVVTAQTPDGQTPAEEQACDKYVGEGARHGLCIAYCEAQDCDDLFKGDPSCFKLAQRFIDWSVKKGFVTGPKIKPTINCKVTACTLDDVELCGGKEEDCQQPDGTCLATCTKTFAGLKDGSPLCKIAPKCEQCSGEFPKIHQN